MPLFERLRFELIGGALSSWPRKGQLPNVVQSMMYALLHKIGITNWCSSSHKSGLFISLATLIYQIGTQSEFSYGVLVFNLIKHHIGSKALWLPICYPRLICGILLSQKPNLLTPTESIGSPPSLFTIHPRLLQSHHVFDIDITTTTSHIDGPTSFNCIFFWQPYSSPLIYWVLGHWSFDAKAPSAKKPKWMKSCEWCRLFYPDLVRVPRLNYGGIDFFLSKKGEENRGEVA